VDAKGIHADGGGHYVCALEASSAGMNQITLQRPRTTHRRGVGENKGANADQLSRRETRSSSGAINTSN